MVTVELNSKPHWDDIFHQVEEGQSIEVLKAGRVVAVIHPASENELNGLADVSAKEMATMFPPKEWAKWDKKHAAG